MELSIYDVAGRKVRDLAAKELDMGAHQIGWDGRDGTGNVLSSGVYSYELRVAERTVETRKALLLR